MAKVLLKNGATVYGAQIESVIDGLRTLKEDYPIAFGHLVAQCYDQRHLIPRGPKGGIIGCLIQLGMMERDGKVFPDIRNIVLSAVEITSPISSAQNLHPEGWGRRMADAR